jgi:ABC-type uncharacterized transport system permease subunit
MSLFDKFIVSLAFAGGTMAAIFALLTHPISVVPMLAFGYCAWTLLPPTTKE